MMLMEYSYTNIYEDDKFVYYVPLNKRQLASLKDPGWNKRRNGKDDVEYMMEWFNENK